MAQLEYFGSRPKMKRLVLTQGQDFWVAFKRKVRDSETGAISVTNYPAGATLTWTFGNGTQWSAVVAGTDAIFDIDKAVTDAVPDGTTYRIVYSAGGVDLVPYKGTVVRDD